MLFWHRWVLGYFRQSILCGRVIFDSVYYKGKFGFSETWKCKFGAHSFHSLHCSHSLCPCSRLYSRFHSPFRLPTSVFVLSFCQLSSMLSSSPWVLFFHSSTKVVKGEYFRMFSRKRNCFSLFKCSSCMISVWGLGLWSKDCSFMGFLMKREYRYLVSRFRVLRKNFIYVIFVKGLRFWERRDVLCVGGKMTISIGLRIDWVWK